MLRAVSLSTRLVHGRRALLCAPRFKSTSSDVPPKDGNAADWLLNLEKRAGQTEGAAAEAESGLSADEKAQQFLSAMKDLRKEWTSETGANFDVNKAFAPEGMEETYDFWAAADAEILQNQRAAQIDATPEQIAEAAALADKPIPPKYDKWMNMLVNHVMRHGEKAKAYKIVNRALYLVFLKIREDPVAKLLAALDKMAPLAQLHRIGDGGARVEVFPVPYSETRRIGLAWKWVIEASQKRQSKDFAVRLGEEILNAIEGRGPGYEKGSAVHKAAVANRSIAEEVQQGRWKRRA